MCIRDSAGDEADRATDAEHAELARQLPRRLGLLVEQHLGCLLYTSDAADERSSVDLGGRRIIKKKTEKTTKQTRRQQTQTQKKEKQR